MTTALPWLGWLLVGRRGYRALGTVLVAAAVARELNVSDIDGRRPVPLSLENV